jgi:hypothetical protein
MFSYYTTQLTIFFLSGVLIGWAATILVQAFIHLKKGEKPLNEKQIPQKIPASIHRHRFVLCILLAFLIGCVLTGIFITLHRPRTIGELDSRYAVQYTRATEIIGKLETELGREREYNRQLREHNNRARELAEGLTDTADRNVRNLQDAVGLIGEIRKKLKVLEDFYADSDTGDSDS